MTLVAVLQIVSIAVWAIYAGRKLIKSMHMLQLNSYRNLRLWNWYMGNFKRTIRVMDVLPIVPLILFAMDKPLWGHIAWIAAFLLLTLTVPKEIEKKKLVYTARVKRLLTTTAILLVVLVGALLPWTPFAALAMYAVTLLPAVFILLANTVNKPIEHQINNYYINDARKKIERHASTQVIGITGSFGKTSVKHFLSTVLSQSYHVLMTPESYNTPMGVTKTIRTYLQPTHEIFISEMGAKQKGDIKEICDIVHPKYGIITAIGEQHLETFKSLENVKATKFELAEALPADGVAFLNLDDENVADQLRKSNLRCKVVTYGSRNPDTDYYAENVRYSRNGCAFAVRVRNGAVQEFETALLGEHNIQNLLACIAVGDTLGIPLPKLAMYIRKVKPVKHRLELKKNGNLTILDDSFNSNPVGSKAALAVLAQMPEKKILVTPGMIELGAKEYEYNYAFAEAAAKVCDYIILVGPKQTKPMQDALQAAGYANFRVAKHLQEGLQFLQGFANEHTVVLLENDLPDNYNE
ncbi:UDP-N-acetylmuramoyl-tripeptide--D-alanyl-D-alanine ligase [Paenibacillus antri]|uniref:UDP-N-acetylmuramoyl-tripeptide--D-alanyl-D-alanine ligase n=1 Tax=Paenibacillus antri TaxID=2582848 RepID=A0A5R9G610_9BACL|nr:UDP-N-acetylmuramoyl-tripeptide--D-alanyl-D-alanine ligase [Paenibacillus antri]TLS49776.1 UDP-N-acetylmuramoyl-tripeptide--D-alanyl-D-alanine ligase [Paenibacillus antri]